MKYSEFKAVLYEVVCGQKEAAGKRIRILEKDVIYTDAETLRLVRMCNAKKWESSAAIMDEDKLCIVWYCGRLPRILYWDAEWLYERFAREGWSGVLPEITEKLRICQYPLHPQTNRQVLRPMNYYSHACRLADAIYWKVGDMALVLHTVLEEDQTGVVTEIYSKSGNRFSPEELLLTNGLLCGRTFFPARLDYIGQRHGGPAEYSLTTAGGMRSAVSLFYPEIREQLADRFKGDYFVGFPSVHEAVIRPVRYGGPGELRAFARSAGPWQDEGEYLTDRVYRFDRKQSRLIEV